MAKLAPGDLAQVLSKLPEQQNENIIVGFDKADDAGVFRLNESIALVQTVDFFTPVADDPETYGRIAAINSMNDVYAMGGIPLTALSIVCFPQSGDWEVLGKIIAGGQKAMIDEGVAVLGGHSVDDSEIKFGYSVTGTVDPLRLITNSGACAGDVLVLTRSIGTGVINTAVKSGIASDEARDAAIDVMTRSAKQASEVMVNAGANACTDITGFGLVGHAYELAQASKATLKIEAGKVPLLPEVIELIERKMLTRGDRNNREYVGQELSVSETVSSIMLSALLDPQTAGGLLISVPSQKADDLVNSIPGSRIIGTVKEYSGYSIEVV